MDYVPIFEPRRARLHGGAKVVEDPWVLHRRALRLAAPGDGITTLVRGRLAGVVVQRNGWGGRIEVRAGATRREVDLYQDFHSSAAVEVDLPGRGLPLPLTVRLLEGSHPSSKGPVAQVLAVYTSPLRTCELPGAIARSVTHDSYEGDRLCQLTDVFKWYDAGWRGAMDALGTCPPYTPPDFVHRKAWEWTQTVYGLDRLGALRPDAKGLGVGVGWEPLSYFFANHTAEVVATDLYPVDDMWSTSGAKEGDPAILEDPDDFAPYPYRKDRVRFLRMDGRTLDFPDASFDYVWSCSSIEHFGGHEGSAAAMREIGRVLVPGGVAAVITEFVLPDEGDFTSFDAEYFNLRCVHDHLLAPAPSLRLVEPLDTSMPDYYRRRAVVLPEEGSAPHGVQKPHVVLRAESGASITSMALFLRKAGGAARAPARPRFPPADLRGKDSSPPA